MLLQTGAFVQRVAEKVLAIKNSNGNLVWSVKSACHHNFSGNIYCSRHTDVCHKAINAWGVIH